MSERNPAAPYHMLDVCSSSQHGDYPGWLVGGKVTNLGNTLLPPGFDQWVCCSAYWFVPSRNHTLLSGFAVSLLICPCGALVVWLGRVADCWMAGGVPSYGTASNVKIGRLDVEILVCGGLWKRRRSRVEFPPMLEEGMLVLTECSGVAGSASVCSWEVC